MRIFRTKWRVTWQKLLKNANTLTYQGNKEIIFWGIHIKICITFSFLQYQVLSDIFTGSYFQTVENITIVIFTLWKYQKCYFQTVKISKLLFSHCENNKLLWHQVMYWVQCLRCGRNIFKNQIKSNELKIFWTLNMEFISLVRQNL